MESMDGKSVEGSIFQGRRFEMVEALKTHHLLRERNSALKAPKDAGPEAFTKWENLFIQTVSSLHFLKEKLYERLGRIGTEVPPFLKKEEKAVAGKLDQFAQDFGRFYRDALPTWEKGEGPRPLMIQDMPSILLIKPLLAKAGSSGLIDSFADTEAKIEISIVLYSILQ